jgi:hypothetical protein
MTNPDRLMPSAFHLESVSVKGSSQTPFCVSASNGAALDTHEVAIRLDKVKNATGDFYLRSINMPAEPVCESSGNAFMV